MNTNSLENNRFKSVSDFKWCVKCGGEIEFEWKGKLYSITQPNGQINIGEGYYIKNDKCYNVISHSEYDISNELQVDTVEEVLEYIIDGDRLHDIITRVQVINRTI